jgi:hypothetical protein
LGRGPGKPKTVRIRGYMEKGPPTRRWDAKGVVILGTFKKTCKELEVGEDGERGPCRNKR